MSEEKQSSYPNTYKFFANDSESSSLCLSKGLMNKIESDPDSGRILIDQGSEQTANYIAASEQYTQRDIPNLSNQNNDICGQSLPHILQWCLRSENVKIPRQQ